MELCNIKKSGILKLQKKLDGPFAKHAKPELVQKEQVKLDDYLSKKKELHK